MYINQIMPLISYKLKQITVSLQPLEGGTMELNENLRQRVRELMRQKWDQHPQLNRLQFQARHPHLYPSLTQHPHPLA